MEKLMKKKVIQTIQDIEDVLSAAEHLAIRVFIFGMALFIDTLRGARGLLKAAARLSIVGILRE
jgi:hypothetical protein